MRQREYGFESHYVIYLQREECKIMCSVAYTMGEDNPWFTKSDTLQYKLDILSKTSNVLYITQNIEEIRGLMTLAGLEHAATVSPYLYRKYVDPISGRL